MIFFETNKLNHVISTYMKLFTEEEYTQAKYTDLLPGKCDVCGDQMFKPKRFFYRNDYNGFGGVCSCSKKCANILSLQSKYIHPKTEVECTHCKKKILKWHYEINKWKNIFCSNSCSALYNNTHRTTGTSISKLEKWIQPKLIALYPHLEFEFNQNTAIGSGLDIYIPSLQLAFELNGPVHYEPIFGPESLNKTQNRDQKKFHLCVEKRIDLCVIDTSSQKYFKESTSQPYLDIIVNIIDKRIGASGGI